MVSRSDERKTIAMSQELWFHIERKRKKEENLEDCLRRLLKYKKRKELKK